MTHYTGNEELQLMDNMENYNSSIMDAIQSHSPDFTVTIDFGAGIGTFAKRVAPLADKLICVENDLAQAKHLEDLGFNCIQNLDELADSSTSFIYTINVLEHIEDDSAILSILFKKLKPGGKLFVYVPAFQFLYSEMDEKVGHYRRYSKNELRNKLAQAGFEVTELFFVDWIGYFASLVYKLQSFGGLNQNKLKFFDRYLFPLNKLCNFALKRLIGKNLIAYAQKNESI
jgi:2-polyprenyl-3-methyl-5-hydroxy-6-metoxy-1,4-benzoquinol methylase